MKVTWFGHSAFRVDYADAAVMIDPFIGNPTFKGDPKAAYAGATHVVLTHGHNDHIGSTVEICKETGALLVANPEVCDFLEAKGVENATPINHGGELALRRLLGRLCAGLAFLIGRCARRHRSVSRQSRWHRAHRRRARRRSSTWATPASSPTWR